MAWAKRPKRDTPPITQRQVTDGRGRTWVGTLTSGTVAGGEEHAEVVFVCRDQPGELKRIARLDLPPARAAAALRALEDAEVLRLLSGSEPA